MSSSSRFQTAILVAVLGTLAGCSLHDGAGTAGRVATGALHGMLHPESLLPHRKQTPPPPKAGIVREVGSIRSVSEDGTYAIIELAPGTTLAPGASLLATGPKGGTVRMKAGEISYPCCVADIEEGQPSPGDVVKK